MQLNHYEKEWHSCPACGADSTILNVYPSKYGGVWECTDCGASDICEHPDTERVSGQDEFGEYEIVECKDCQLSLDEVEA